MLGDLPGAGVRGIVFDEDWTYPEEFERTYRAWPANSISLDVSLSASSGSRDLGVIRD